MSGDTSDRHLRVVRPQRHLHSTTSGDVPQVRLYTVYSISEVEKENVRYHQVRLNWYCLERPGPAAPYGNLIADYELLPKRVRHFLEAEVNRYLTESEVAALRRFLAEHHHMPVVAEEVPLPIEAAGPFARQGAAYVYDFIELPAWEGYDLPFQAWGYYTLENCPTSPVLKTGIEFLEKAFALLGIADSFATPRLRRVVEKLYSENGLYVKTDRESA